MNGFIAAFAALLCLGFTATSTLDSEKGGSIDHVIADAAYNKVMPVVDLEYAPYHQRVTDRLEYLETLLRSRDVSAWPEELRRERMNNIERLHAYRLQGKFPINYDHPDKQLPCFYDRDGNLCAVANLIAKSAGMDLVRKINDRHQYATVSEMKMPEIDAWIAASGLTRAEVITIQEPGSFSEPGMEPRQDYKRPTFAIPVDSLPSQPPIDTVNATAPSPVKLEPDVFPGLSQIGR